MVGRASCMAIDMVNGVLVEGTGVMNNARKVFDQESGLSSKVLSR